MLTSEIYRTVTVIKPHLAVIPAFAIVALLAGAPPLAQANSARGISDISLVIDGGPQVAVLPVISETAQSDLLSYDFTTGEIQFSAGVLSPDYDEPLFCFDMAGTQSPVSLHVTDPNGHVIIGDFNLDASLDYVLTAPSTLVVKASAGKQCFYRSDQGVFGLFGQAENAAEPADRIMSSRFEIKQSLSLEYQDVPAFVTLGETVSYDLVVTNTGEGNLNEVGLQELFPENLGVYAAALNNTSWSCTATGDAVCPTESVDPGTLRFQDFNTGGADITPGDSLTFTIERTVDANSITGESIRLQAGVVADPVSSGTPFAVDEALMTVIGQSAGLSVSTSEATADSEPTQTVADDAVITVTVLDGNLNPVPDETVTLADGTGLTFTSGTSGVSDVNGEVVFTATSAVADDYPVSFTSGGLNGSGVVRILPGAPESFFLQTAGDGQAVADGQDAVQVHVLVEDAQGNPVDASPVEVSDDDGLTSLPPEEFTDTSGIATFSATSDTVGVFEPIFSVPGVGSSPATLEFVPGDPAELVFTLNPPSVVTAGSDFDVSLQVVDSSGNWVSDDQDTFITLNLLQGGSTVEGGLSDGTVENGEATFTLNLGSSYEGSNYRIQAVASGTGFFGANSTVFEVAVPQQ